MPSRRQFLLSLPAVLPLAGCASIPPDATRRAGGVADPSSTSAVWRPEGGPDSSSPKPAAPATLTGDRYICPMHPEVNEPRPGTCPKCHMALELKKSGGAQ